MFSYFRMVGDYINTMKTTFDFNFDLYQGILNSMNAQKHRNKKKLSINSFPLITCTHVIRKKHVNN